MEWDRVGRFSWWDLIAVEGRGEFSHRLTIYYLVKNIGVTRCTHEAYTQAAEVEGVLLQTDDELPRIRVM